MPLIAYLKWGGCEWHRRLFSGVHAWRTKFMLEKRLLPFLIYFEFLTMSTTSENPTV